MKQEEIIISLTTWKPRMHNIPIVLDAIRNQTVKPDRIVVNIAHDEIIPNELNDYFAQHGVEVNRVQDTKVYKKFLPTLLKYPEACVVNIDDDFIYPPYMIEDFMKMHKKYPNHPISGNRQTLYGMQCHCGCASLTKKEYFGDYLESIDENLMKSCLSSDLVFTYLATLAGHPYLRSRNMYYHNLKAIESTESYSTFDFRKVLDDTYNYLRKRFGDAPDALSLLSSDKRIMHDWSQMALLYEIDNTPVVNKPTIKNSSWTYRIWKLSFAIWSMIKPIIKRKK